MLIGGESLGYAAATVAAMLWAAATMLYGRAGRVLPPMSLNAVKGVFATTLFAITLAILGRPGHEELLDLDRWRLWLLAASGVLGIAVGDSFYFACVNALGARRCALLSLLATPLVVIGGALVLGESLTPPAWLGAGLTVAGVAWVVAERAPTRVASSVVQPAEAAEPARSEVHVDLWVGVVFGLIAALCQAVGALMNRGALADLPAGALDPLTTATWRLGTATLVLLPIVAVIRATSSASRTRTNASLVLWATVAAAALMGTYGGIWLQQVGFTHAPAGPVQTLLSTTPVWVLPLAALSGERVTLRAVFGALVAVAGVALLVGARAIWTLVG